MKTAARLARRADDAALRGLLRAWPVGAPLALRFEREPDFFAGPPAQTVAVFAGQELAGMASRARRPAFVNGRAAEAGWLRQMRVLPGSPALAVLSSGAAALRRLHRDGRSPYYLAALAGEDSRSARLLGTGRLGLPVAHFRDRLVTLSFGVRPAVHTHAESAPAWPALSAFLRGQMPAFQFAPRYPVRPRDGREWLAVRGPAGLRGVAALVDERAHRQIRVARMPWSWRALRPMLNAVMPALRGWPALPAPGALVQSASLGGFCATDLDAAQRLLDAALAVAAGRGLRALNLCLSEGHPWLAGLRRRGGLAVESRLALMHWPDGAAAIRRLDSRPAHLDAPEL